VLALLAWGLLELSSFAALRLVASRNGLAYRRLEDFFGAKDREAIAKFLRVGEGFYYRPDADLGWVPRPSTHVAASGAYQPTTTNARGYTPETAMRLAKPRFMLEGDRLVLRPTPLRSVEDYRPLLDDPAPTLASMGRDDLWYQRSGWHPGTPLDVLPSVRLARLGRRFARRLLDPPAFETGWIPGGQAYRVTEAVLARFAESVRESGAVPVVVFFPNRNDLQRRREGKPELGSPLVEAIRRRGIESVDLLEPIHAGTSALPMEQVFGAVHYSADTNALVARTLGDVVDRHRAITPRAAAPPRRPVPGPSPPPDEAALPVPARSRDPRALDQCLQRSAWRPLFLQSESAPGRSFPAPSENTAEIGPFGCGTPVTAVESFFAVTVSL